LDEDSVEQHKPAVVSLRWRLSRQLENVFQLGTPLPGNVFQLWRKLSFFCDDLERYRDLWVNGTGRC
jgi:hypothetical protein